VFSHTQSAIEPQPTKNTLTKPVADTLTMSESDLYGRPSATQRFVPPLFRDATNGINNTLVIAFSSPVPF
ncbi:MAG: hypothetical protein ACK6A4_03535, partial [Alphaproteobacteria bacterium]